MKSILKSTTEGAGGMAQQLGTQSTLPEDPCSISSAHDKLLTASWNPLPGDPMSVSTHTWMHLHTPT